MSYAKTKLEEARDEIERLKRLVDELADALEFYEDCEIGVAKELLQRAKEATK